MGLELAPFRGSQPSLLNSLRRLRNGKSGSVSELLEDVRDPPVDKIGSMDFDEFLPRKDRNSLATALNTLLASPTFESWRQGAPLDVGQWLAPREDGRTPAVIVSVAHLDEQERMLVLGVVLATQNPMDLDYRALSNAGLWFVGRLQTDADRERVVEAMASEGGLDGADEGELSEVLKRLSPRWFAVRNMHRAPRLALLHSRTTNRRPQLAASTDLLGPRRSLNERGRRAEPG